MLEHTFYLQRTLWQRSRRNDTWEDRVTWLLRQTLAGRRITVQGWRIRERDDLDPLVREGYTVFRTRVVLVKAFQNKASTELQQFQEIKERLNELGESTRFGQCPVVVLGELDDPVEPLVTPLIVKHPDEIEIPTVLISGSDEEVEQHESTLGIYGRAPHLRILFNALDAALRSRFTILNHVLIEGPPGSAKSTMVDSLKRVVGTGGYHEFNCSSLTVAGFQRLFLKQYRDPNVPHTALAPPVLILEELEVLTDDCAEILLRLLDSAHEIRKTTNLGDDYVTVNCFCVGLINDTVRFEKLAKGALKRRFSRKIHVPLPDRSLIERIIQREVDRQRGPNEWVEAILDLMDATGSRDTTEIISWLEGRERLLDPQYRRDILATRSGGVRYETLELLKIESRNGEAF